MFNLSLHLLDILQNSLRAKATSIEIEIIEDLEEDLLIIAVEDDGEGMDEKLQEKALDPFGTTKDRKHSVGLGLPLFRQIALDCGGEFELISDPEDGTSVKATFRHSHVDRPPLGDIASTIQALLVGQPELEISYVHRVDGSKYEFETEEVKQELGELEITHPKVLGFINQEISSSLEDIRPSEYLKDRA